MAKNGHFGHLEGLCLVIKGAVFGSLGQLANGLDWSLFFGGGGVSLVNLVFFGQNGPFLGHFGAFLAARPFAWSQKGAVFGPGGLTPRPEVVCWRVHFGGNCFNACSYWPMWQCVHFRRNCFSACSY